MPAVLDSIGGAGWLRGFLPVLNRAGQSIPPVLLARRIKVMRKKKWAMACCTFLMACSFLSLSIIWLVSGDVCHWWNPGVFLAIYALFFMSVGVNQISFVTLQGKLIRVTHRGRLLLVANVGGAACAVIFALCLLPYWLQDEGHFGLIFGFAGSCFALSALAAMGLSESPDNYSESPSPLRHIFRGAAQILRSDHNFRRLALVGALFGTSMMLFPHYQALGLKEMSLTLDKIMWWVVAQNIGMGLFSFPVGMLADKYGYRLVLRLAMGAICGAPLSAIALSHAGDVGTSYFFLVFVLVGLTPLTIKMLNNYTLEISEPADHPRYLSTLSLCMTTPMLLSPLIGGLVDVVGFEAVFLAITFLMITGWLLTFGLKEPRRHVIDPLATSTAVEA